MKKSVLLFLVGIILTGGLRAQALLIDNFNYGSTDTLTNNGWIVTAANTVNIIRANNPALTYAGYPNSGQGNSALINNNGQDIFKDASSSINTGSAYVSFMANVDTAQAAGDYFFALLPNSSQSNFTGRLFAKRTSAGYFKVAINKSTETSVYSNDSFAFGTVYLYVIQYQFNTTNATDDSIRMYVFTSSVPATQPASATITASAASGSDAPNITRVVLRQGSASQAARVYIGGIRMSNSWSNSPLPVQLTRFTGSVKGTAASLSWATASEVNNSYFDIERSNDGRSFESIGRVKGAGNSSRLINYSFTDAAPAKGLNTYRLRQVDADGKSTYSKNVVISFVAAAKVAGIEASTPNPFNNELNVTVNVKQAGTATVEVVDMLGKQQYSDTESLSVGANKVYIDTNTLPNGIYFVRITQNGETFTHKVIKK